MNDIRRSQIVQLIDKLDHPDAVYQQEIVEKITELGYDVVPILSANLALVNARVRRGIVNALGKFKHDQSIVPLMRYVFDMRNDLEEANGRALAMKALIAMIQPSNADRFFGFAVDVLDDHDIFVRGFALEMLAMTGNSRALPYLKDALTDEEDQVRQSARRAMKLFENKNSSANEHESLSAQAVLDGIRHQTGHHRDHYITILQTRDDAFEITEELLFEGSPYLGVGLRILLQLDDTRCRRVVSNLLSADLPSDHLAIALRVLSKHLQGDITPRERTVIQQSMYHTDPFVSSAAIKAAASSGEASLMKQAISSLHSDNAYLVAEVARAISQVSTSGYEALMPAIRMGFDKVHARRLKTLDDTWVRAEAYLLRAMSRMIDEELLNHHDLQRAALQSLKQASAFRPIVITALTLLDKTVPTLEKATNAKWTDEECELLVSLLKHDDVQVRERATDLLRRAAPDKWQQLANNSEVAK